MTYFFQGVSQAPFVYVYAKAGSNYEKINAELPGVSSAPTNISVSPGGEFVAVGGSGETRIYRIAQDVFHQVSTLLVVGAQNPRLAGWSRNGGRFWRTDGGNTVKIFLRLGEIFEHEISISVGTWIYDAAFVDDDLILVANNGDSTLALYRLMSSGSAQLVWSDIPVGWANLFCVSPDGVYIVVPTAQAKFLVFKRSGDEFTYLSAVPFPVDSYPASCSFSGDGSTLIVTLEYGWVCQFQRQGDAFSEIFWSQDKPTYNNDAVVFNQDDSLFVIPLTGSSGRGLVRTFGRAGNHYEGIGYISTSGEATAAASFSPPRGFAAGYKPISGHVFDADGNPVSRIVRAYHRSTGNLVAEAVSDPVTGEYGFNAYKLTPHYIVVLDDGEKNALIRDHITPIDLP